MRAELDRMFLAALDHHRAGRAAEAEAGYRRILGRDPDHFPALCEFGRLAFGLGRHDVARALFGRAAGLDEADRVLRNNLGNAQEHCGDLAAALATHRRNLAEDPAFPEGWSSLGNVLKANGRLDGAIAAYRRSVAAAPDYVAGLGNLGAALHQATRDDEAIAVTRRALALLDDPDLHHNLSHALLSTGRLAEGWHEYDWRRQTAQHAPTWPRLAGRRWTGEGGQGGTLLIHAEQGLGDMLQFCRYVPLAAARGWRVVVEVQAPLVPLLRRLDGAAVVVARGDALPPCDAYCPMMSLPGIFGTTLETIPAAVPYLAAEPDKVAAWRPRLAGQIRVGLAWAGNPQLAADSRRSLAPDLLAPLLDLAGITFFSLQKDRPAPPGVVDLMAGVADFGDTAALVANLDLVIAVDSAVAHLAGAMGRPVWLLNRFDAEWRWLRDRDDSPWYPTLRQFRQAAPGDWPGVIARVRAELARMGDPSSSHWQKDALCSI